MVPRRRQRKPPLRTVRLIEHKLRCRLELIESFSAASRLGSNPFQLRQNPQAGKDLRLGGLENVRLSHYLLSLPLTDRYFTQADNPLLLPQIAHRRWQQQGGGVSLSQASQGTGRRIRFFEHSS